MCFSWCMEASSFRRTWNSRNWRNRKNIKYIKRLVVHVPNGWSRAPSQVRGIFPCQKRPILAMAESIRRSRCVLSGNQVRSLFPAVYNLWNALTVTYRSLTLWISPRTPPAFLAAAHGSAATNGSSLHLPRLRSYAFPISGSLGWRAWMTERKNVIYAKSHISRIESHHFTNFSSWRSYIPARYKFLLP